MKNLALSLLIAGSLACPVAFAHGTAETDSKKHETTMHDDASDHHVKKQGKGHKHKRHHKAKHHHKGKKMHHEGAEHDKAHHDKMEHKGNMEEKKMEHKPS